MYLLDTNVVSELRKTRCDRNVKRWVEARDPGRFFLSVMELMELEYGLCLVEGRDERLGSMLRTWLQEAVLPSFEGRVLGITLPIASICALTQAKALCGVGDTLIAATSVHHRMIVVSRNVRDFKQAGIEVTNP